MILLWVQSRGGPVPLGTAIYGASVVLLFATSSLYHGRFWSPEARVILGRIDHAAIFLLIAGTFTPLGLLLGTTSALAALVALWIGALVGIYLVVRPGGVGKRLRATIYVGLGWVIVPLVPALLGLLGWQGLLLLFGGGLLYTIGAVVYAIRRPDFFPRIFGFHEVFHLLVIGAAACHFAVIARIVLPR